VIESVMEKGKTFENRYRASEEFPDPLIIGSIFQPGPTPGWQRNTCESADGQRESSLARMGPTGWYCQRSQRGVMKTWGDIFSELETLARSSMAHTTVMGAQWTVEISCSRKA
jgi:hypothetical protein